MQSHRGVSDDLARYLLFLRITHYVLRFGFFEPHNQGFPDWLFHPCLVHLSCPKKRGSTMLIWVRCSIGWESS